jgi:hypothetical protein
MSDDSLLSGITRRQRLVAEITWLQLKGAGIAAAVFFGIWLGISILNWVGTTILPEESQLADDPGSDRYINMPDQ